jgi:DNA primase
MIPKEFINSLLAKTGIAELATEFTELTPSGSQLRGYCPFRNYKKPLFNVSIDKQIYKCFSCNLGGNATSFIMAIKQLPYPKAIRFLA